jgi:lycopene beta-cyclase
MSKKPAYTKDFDYIIAGAGCAGLSLALHLIHSGAFKDKRILLVDRDSKKANDRTWCFWQTEPGLFEPVVFRQWQKLWFHSDQLSRELSISPYHYKMIRGEDFYSYCLEIIRKQRNFTVWQEEVSHLIGTREATGIVIKGKAYLCDYLFNSILFRTPSLKKNQYWLLQHFKGWTIETPGPAFEPGRATLMDFRIDQQWGTAFCYVLPFSATRALVEYTLFSRALLQQEQYNEGLKQYLQQWLGLKEYTVVEEEFGIIPMTNYAFPGRRHNLVHLGTAGGQTKGSSGYTFSYIQKHSAAIVKQLIKKGDPFVSKSSGRYGFYDSVLLNILHHDTLPGRDIFSDLFRKNDPALVLKFLDNETSIPEELKIISTLPTLPFMKAALQQIF